MIIITIMIRFTLIMIIISNSEVLNPKSVKRIDQTFLSRESKGKENKNIP